MTTWIVSYADAAFRSGQQRLVASALAHGVETSRAWDRAALERTAFYPMHKTVLDMRRGGGYWLWKPYIIKEALREAAEGDVIIYADAGVEIVRDVAPLVDLCREHELLLFAGHYEDIGGPGPNTCGKWTKRDAFVFMDCDDARFHTGQMLDASSLVVAKSARTERFVREWLLLCCQPALLTDAPNVCGLPDLDGYIEHRHDQSLLALLAIREELEIFRHPSQNGNHVKLAAYVEADEWMRWPHGSRGVYANSPYPTILRHHCGFLGQKGLRLDVRRTIRRPRERLFQAWLDPNVWRHWTYLECTTRAVHLDSRPGGRFCLEIESPHAFEITDLLTGKISRASGVYAAIDPPRTIVCEWPPNTRLFVEFREVGAATEVIVTHVDFPSERSREAYRRTWRAFLEVLAEV